MRFVRTTAIGGVLFLLPLIVVGVIIGQVIPVVLPIAESLDKFLPDVIKTFGGVTLLIILAILILLMLCFSAGVIAQISLSRSLSAAFEKKLVLLFPRYAILKDQMADSIGGEQARPQMKPALVQCDGMKRIAFETERSTDLGIVTVYLPGSPDPWAGIVAIFNVDQIESLNAEFGEAVAICEQLGRGTERLLTKPCGTATLGP